MYFFWNNITKLPRFFISVLIGFFLTTLNPFFGLLRNNKNNIIIPILMISFIIILVYILKLMLGIN
uniref:Uncharacterized protein ycf33 n=1 Tax=Sporolithon durum TaxID=48970 RepID=A0A141SD59_9FLOR|nr:hypothetical protein Sdur_195 [Sporolithon durum]AMK96227.1 hypothetical protein Sdur_195 [Sporolithon durum]